MNSPEIERILIASKFVLDETDNPESGGKMIDIALNDLRTAIYNYELKFGKIKEDFN